MNIDKQIHFLNQNEASLLVNSINDLKHKCLILIMLDAGLRVSEAISLQFSNFDFKNKMLTVKSLKKRKYFSERSIPLSQRLFLSLADYTKEFAKIEPGTYLFPSPVNNRNHINRQSVHNYLSRLSFKKVNIQNLHPHTLRHSFATSLVATGSPLNEIADLLGHQDLNTSRIYTHIPKSQLEKSVKAAAARNGDKRSLLLYFFSWLFAKQQPVIYIPNQSRVPIVGRSSELQTITNNLNKGTNVILFGGYGTGKRLLLDSIKPDRKVLTFDDSASIKKSLIYMIAYLCNNDKKQVAALLFSDIQLDNIEPRLTRQSISFLCDCIKSMVEPKEYILKIKQFDDITRQSLKALDLLKDTFVIYTAATEISITKAPFFGNFEKIEVKNLNRIQSFELIHKISGDLQIENYEVYRDHIWNQTNGNPRAITDMVERYRNEPVLVTETIRNVTHSGVIREFDFSYVLVLLIASLAIMRYMTSELDNPAFRTVGGAAMIFLLITRAFVSRTKRKLI